MKNWTVGKRIYTGFGALLLCLMILMGVAINAMTRTGSAVTTVDTEYLPVAEHATTMERSILTARIHFVYLLLANREGSAEKGRENIQRGKVALQELASALRASGTIETDTDMQDLQRLIQELERDMAEYETIAEQVIRARQGGEWNEQVQADFTQRWAPVGNRLSDVSAEIGRKAVAKSRRSSQASAELMSTMTMWLIGLAVLSLLIAVAVSMGITGSITGQLRRSAGNLANGSRQLSQAAAQLSEASQTLSTGSSEQAAALEETSATTEEIHSMANRNMENSQHAAALSNRSASRFTEAGESLNKVVAAVDSIAEQGKRISKIVKTIDEIAFQTNLLALNAAVEAARAGEAGLGFAVVADEVRTLAQRSAQAAKDTATLISETIERSDDGKSKMDVMVSLFAAITEEEKQVKELVDEVNLGSQEQARGVDQIAKAITQIEGVTQRNAAAAEESASAAEELAAQSISLDQVVSELEAIVGH